MKKTFLILACLSLSWALACERAREAQGPAPAPKAEEGGVAIPKQTAEENPTSVSLANVVLHPKNKEAILLTVETARSAEEKRQGLQGRESLPDKHGMWFVFDEDGQDPFWMKDTLISLDILFVDKNYKIVDFVQNASPNSETLIVSREKYRYALEIKAGSVSQAGLAVGDSVEFRLGPP